MEEAALGHQEQELPPAGLAPSQPFIALPPHQRFVEISPETLACPPTDTEPPPAAPDPPALPPRPPEKGRKWMTRAQADACQRAFHEWDGSVRDKGKEIDELAKQTGLTPAQIKKRFDYVRKQLRKGGLNELVPPGCDVDKQWTQVANNIAGRQQKKKKESPTAAQAVGGGGAQPASGPSSNKRKGVGGGSMLAEDGAALSEGGESASVGGQSVSTSTSSKKYKFSHAQSLACVKKFDAWGGSVAGRKKEVQELAAKLGLTVSQVKKRFDYLRQRKFKSHLDGAGTQRMLEVAVEDVQSAMLAKEGGAHRVEVQANLSEGGVTASIGLVSQIVRLLRKRPRVKVFALCRPRTGDFCYSNDEYEVLKKEIQAMKMVGVDGVVFGVLKDDCSIDGRRCKALVTAARPLSVTFSRAFDDVRDPAKALDDLMAMGIERVVTAGLARTAWEGQHTIRALVARATGKMVIVAGGGVDEANVLPLMEATGVHEVHVGSFAQQVLTVPYAPDRTPDKPLTYSGASFERIRAMRHLIAPGWEEGLSRRRKGRQRKGGALGRPSSGPPLPPLPSGLPGEQAVGDGGREEGDEEGEEDEEDDDDGQEEEGDEQQPAAAEKEGGGLVALEGGVAAVSSFEGGSEQHFYDRDAAAAAAYQQHQQQQLLPPQHHHPHHVAGEQQHPHHHHHHLHQLPALPSVVCPGQQQQQREQQPHGVVEGPDSSGMPQEEEGVEDGAVVGPTLALDPDISLVIDDNWW